ncbi:dual specificity phosphatase DUPD1-like [Solea senegalensis]|uniref:Dual specificity phosphatase DUPD1-like n=1 Tax=Solea senegalensis TaxID=28829 RepID=A0AAV6RQ27_SOLSE|nr:dual specificity phosphatase DUPD1-like [Solea senegalensis]
MAAKEGKKTGFNLFAHQSCVKRSRCDKMASHKSKTGTKINVTKAESSPVDEYVTPGGYELEKILNRGIVVYTHVNEVWPHVYIGDEETAKDKYTLKRLGITHILNAAEGTWNNVDTGACYYSDMDVVYYGVVAEDVATFDLSQYFFSAARFIEETLKNPQSKTTANIREVAVIWNLDSWVFNQWELRCLHQNILHNIDGENTNNVIAFSNAI